MRLSFPRPGSAVVWLIVINVGMAFIDAIVGHWRLALSELLGLSVAGLRSYHFWQPVSYMFMHGGALHLLFNMIGLYVFGTEFERHFGTRRFLQFYFTCGVCGGLAYLALGLLSPAYHNVPLIGASGAVFGLLMAAVIFFPQIQVILFLFPIPVRLFGLIIGGLFLLQALGSGSIENLGGEICHLGGALTGLGVFYVWGVMPRIKIGSRWSAPAEIRSGAWARRQQRLADEQAEVDRILEKVHRNGLQSLSWNERRALSRATQRQRERDRSLERIDQL